MWFQEGDAHIFTFQIPVRCSFKTLYPGDDMVTVNLKAKLPIYKANKKNVNDLRQ